MTVSGIYYFVKLRDLEIPTFKKELSFRKTRLVTSPSINSVFTLHTTNLLLICFNNNVFRLMTPISIKARGVISAFTYAE